MARHSEAITYRNINSLKYFFFKYSAQILFVPFSVVLGITFLAFPTSTLWALIALFIFTLVFIKPMYGLYLIIPLIPVKTFNLVIDSPLRKVSEGYTVASILIVIVYVAVTLHWAAKKDRFNIKSHIDVLLLIFLVWAFTTLSWTSDYYHGVNMFFEAMTGVAILFIFQKTIRNTDELKRIFYYTVLSSLFLAIIVFTSKYYYGQIFSIHVSNRAYVLLGILSEEGKRVGGFAPPQTSANWLAIASFLLLTLYLQKGFKLRLFLSLTAFILMLNILLCGSKGAVGALILGFFATVILNPLMRRKAISWIFAFTGIFTTAFLFNMFILSEKRFTASAKISEASLSYRLEFWKTGFKSLAKNAWLGEGIGGFAKLVDPWPGAHSFYFTILFDLGFIGFGLFMAFLFMRVMRLVMAVPRCNNTFLSNSLYCMIGALITFFVHGIVEMDYTYLHFWMLMGLAERVTSISMQGLTDDRRTY